MPTPSSATTHSPRLDPLSQLGGNEGAPPATVAPRKRVARTRPAAPAPTPAPAEPEPEPERPLTPPLPRPAARGGAQQTVAKFIRFDAEGADRLVAAAEQLRCSQTDLVKSAVTYYLDLLERERDAG